MIRATLVRKESRLRDRKRRRILLRIGARTWHMTRDEAARLYRTVGICLWRMQKEDGQ